MEYTLTGIIQFRKSLKLKIDERGGLGKQLDQIFEKVKVRVRANRR